MANEPTITKPKVRVSPDVHRDLKVYADTIGEDMQDLASVAIREMLDRRKVVVIVTIGGTPAQ